MALGPLWVGRWVSRGCGSYEKLALNFESIIRWLHQRCYWMVRFNTNDPPLTHTLMPASFKPQALGIFITAPHLSCLLRADCLPRQHLASPVPPNCRPKIGNSPLEDPQDRLFRIPHPCHHSCMLLSGYNHESCGRSPVVEPFGYLPVHYLSGVLGRIHRGRGKSCQRAHLAHAVAHPTNSCSHCRGQLHPESCWLQRTVQYPPLFRGCQASN